MEDFSSRSAPGVYSADDRNSRSVSTKDIEGRRTPEQRESNGSYVYSIIEGVFNFEISILAALSTLFLEGRRGLIIFH